MKPVFVILPLAVLLFIGCEGDAGKAGIDLINGDYQSPVVNIIFPIAARPLYGHSVIELDIQETDTVTGITFFVDGEAAPAANFHPLGVPFQYLWDSQSLATGKHTLQVEATDRRNSGLSPIIFLNRADGEVPPTNDTLRYNTGLLPGRTFLWTLPDPTTDHLTGIGTRFFNQFPGLIHNVNVWVTRDSTWGVLKPVVSIMTSKNGLPDSLLASRNLLIRGKGQYEGWVNVDFRVPELSINGEFFVLVTPPENYTGADTLGFGSDDGVWRNGHSYVRQNDRWGQVPWSTKYNFLIETVFWY